MPAQSLYYHEGQHRRTVPRSREIEVEVFEAGFYNFLGDYELIKIPTAPNPLLFPTATY